MLTALSDEEHRRKAANAGPPDHHQAVDPDVLMAAIKDNAGGNGNGIRTGLNSPA